jgi:surfeit locus 1 family protein
MLMVNLGWVPVENKNDIEMGGEPLGTTTEDEPNPHEIPNAYTSFARNPAVLSEDLQMPFVEFVGMVRRGEKQNILRKRRNWPKEGLFNYVDLFYMARLFRSFNLDGASTAYLERVVPELDEDAEYPLPATKDNFVKDALSPEAHSAYSAFYGIAGLISLAALFTG